MISRSWYNKWWSVDGGILVVKTAGKLPTQYTPNDRHRLCGDVVPRISKPYMLYFSYLVWKIYSGKPQWCPPGNSQTCGTPIVSQGNQFIIMHPTLPIDCRYGVPSFSSANNYAGKWHLHSISRMVSSQSLKCDVQVSVFECCWWS